jgi:hypothetical protein
MSSQRDSSDEHTPLLQPDSPASQQVDYPGRLGSFGKRLLDVSLLVALAFLFQINYYLVFNPLSRLWYSPGEVSFPTNDRDSVKEDSSCYGETPKIMPQIM